MTEAAKAKIVAVAGTGIFQNMPTAIEAGDALGRAKEKYHRIYDSFLVGIFYSTPEGRFIDVNPYFAKMLGYDSPEDLIESIDDIATQYYVSPHDRERYLDILEEKGYGENIELEVKAKDGSHVWLNNSSRAQRGEDGKISYYEGIVIDITERKRAETALRESEARFRLFAELAPVSIIITDHHENLLYMSERFSTLFGYTLEDIPSVEQWWPLAYPDEHLRNRVRREWQEAVAEAQATGSTIKPMEASVVCKDGNVRYVEFRCASTASLNFVVFLDITARRKTQTDLRESEERFHKAFIASPAPLVISDLDSGQFFDVNDRWIEMVGYTRKELIGRQAGEMDIWADHDEQRRLVRLLRSQGYLKDEPIVFKNKSGLTIQALWSAESVSLGGHQVILSMIYDESERKRSEQERDKLQKQLIQAQKLESVGRLAGGVAHDYNNMLSVIMGYTEIALDKVPLQDPLHADLMEIYKAGKRSTEITRQLLAFARKQTIAPQVVDLNTVVSSTLRMLHRLIGEDIDLSWQPANQSSPIMIDPAQIDQILANLCVNARDAIAGVGKIAIETKNVHLDEAYCEDHPGSCPGDFCLLAVSDNGCGMDKETLDNIFEPFFTTKGLSEGTGLGLATVYGTVKQNHGFINVVSEPGNGATFSIFLPRHAETVKTTPETTSVEAPRSHGETVLLVEDEPAIMKMTQLMLQRLGYKVVTAAGPLRAMALAEAHTGDIDLLLTDVVMPEMNGRDLADNLQALRRGIRTVFMSGYTADVIAHRGVLDKGVDFIQKPFSMKDLAVKVRTALDR